MKTTLLYIISCLALVIVGLAGPVYANDGCGKDKRVDMPNCASYSSKKSSGQTEITVKNNCSYKMQVKVDMKSTWSCWWAEDENITVEPGHKNKSDWLCGKLSGVYCCKSWWDSGKCPDEN